MFKFEVINNGKTLRISAQNEKELRDYVNNQADDYLTSYSPNTYMVFAKFQNDGWKVYEFCDYLIITHVQSGRMWSNRQRQDYYYLNPLGEILDSGYVDFQLESAKDKHWDVMFYSNDDNKRVFYGSFRSEKMMNKFIERYQHRGGFRRFEYDFYGLNDFIGNITLIPCNKNGFYRLMEYLYTEK